MSMFETTSGNFGRRAASAACEEAPPAAESTASFVPELITGNSSANCFKVFSSRAKSRHPETPRPDPHGVMFNAHRTGDPCTWKF
jgi:hypothetical protein